MTTKKDDPDPELAKIVEGLEVAIGTIVDSRERMRDALGSVLDCEGFPLHETGEDVCSCGRCRKLRTALFGSSPETPNPDTDSLLDFLDRTTQTEEQAKRIVAAAAGRIVDEDLMRRIEVDVSRALSHRSSKEVRVSQSDVDPAKTIVSVPARLLVGYTAGEIRKMGGKLHADIPDSSEAVHAEGGTLQFRWTPTSEEETPDLPESRQVETEVWVVASRPYVEKVVGPEAAPPTSPTCGAFYMTEEDAVEAWQRLDKRVRHSFRVFRAFVSIEKPEDEDG